MKGRVVGSEVVDPFTSLMLLLLAMMNALKPFNVCEVVISYLVVQCWLALFAVLYQYEIALP